MAIDMSKTPRWFLVLINGACLLFIFTVARDSYAESKETKKIADETKIRVEILERRFDRFEDKIDRIGDRLGVKV